MTERLTNWLADKGLGAIVLERLLTKFSQFLSTFFHCIFSKRAMSQNFHNFFMTFFVKYFTQLFFGPNFVVCHISFVTIFFFKNISNYNFWHIFFLITHIHMLTHTHTKPHTHTQMHTHIHKFMHKTHIHTHERHENLSTKLVSSKNIHGLQQQYNCQHWSW